MINVYRVEPRENLKNKKNNRNQLVSQKRKKKHTPTTQERNRETHNTSISFNSISLDLSFFLSGALFCFLIILARWKEVENARVCVCVDLIMTVRQDKHWIGRMYIYQMPSAAAAAAAWWCHSSSWGRQQPPPEKSYPATWEIHLGDLAEQTPWLFSSERARRHLRDVWVVKVSLMRPTGRPSHGIIWAGHKDELWASTGQRNMKEELLSVSLPLSLCVYKEYQKNIKNTSRHLHTTCKIDVRTYTKQGSSQEKTRRSTKCWGNLYKEFQFLMSRRVLYIAM